MKAYWGSGGIAPRILDLGTNWRCGGPFHAPAALPRGKRPLYPLDRRLSGPRNLSGRGGEKKNSQPLPGLEPPIIQPISQRYTTELTRLLDCSLNKLIFLNKKIQWEVHVALMRDDKCI
jgi:hypothetical protein